MVVEKKLQLPASLGGDGGQTSGSKGKPVCHMKKGPIPLLQLGQGGDYRLSPNFCVMGHSGTGKTKLLECILRGGGRGTGTSTSTTNNVREGGEPTTLRIGATYFPSENIRGWTKRLLNPDGLQLQLPGCGLLAIDTPGHKSFMIMRDWASRSCHIAILFVDIIKGLEPQTLESFYLLKMAQAKFIVALNKVDSLPGWKTCPNAPIQEAMKQQSGDVHIEFQSRLLQIMMQFESAGLDTQLYYKDKDKEIGETIAIVPTSAISGEGIPDLLLLLDNLSWRTMGTELALGNKVQCTVLDVKLIEGHGATVDVVLLKGVLHEGDQIVLCGFQGPIVTTVRALLTNHPTKEPPLKETYLLRKEIKAAQQINISAQGLEDAIPGTGLYVVGPRDDLDDVKEVAMDDMKSVRHLMGPSDGRGVYVQASSFWLLETLLDFVEGQDMYIPVNGIGIGPVHEKDVRDASVNRYQNEYASILAFDVKVTPEARRLADELRLTIFMADTIDQLFDQFRAHILNIMEEKRRELEMDTVFPCILKIMPDSIFGGKDPIILGVEVLEGRAKVGTPICIRRKNLVIDIGRIASVESNSRPVELAQKGQKVTIKILGTNSEEKKNRFGMNFGVEDELFSHISRRSIDVINTYYRKELPPEEFMLIFELMDRLWT